MGKKAEGFLQEMIDRIMVELHGQGTAASHECFLRALSHALHNEQNRREERGKKQRAANDHLIIVLTNRAPIRIVQKDWPIIAEYRQPEPGEEFVLATRAGPVAIELIDTMSGITVRQHADGRTIVYGGRHCRGKCVHRCGTLLDVKSTQLTTAIYVVGAKLKEGPILAEQVIARLPVEDI